MAHYSQLWQQLVGFALWLILVLAAGYFGSQFEPGQWYENLVKPSWTPPSWVFGPVWIIMYILMAIAVWLVWKEHGLRGAPWAIGFFVMQLVLNAMWSWIFFGLEAPGWAFAEIVALWGAILTTMLLFFCKNVTAGWLIVPYLAWVTFAAILNATIWLLN
jgi:translocator protein